MKNIKLIAIIAVAFFAGTIVTSGPVQNVVAANPTLTDLFTAVGLIKAKTDNLPADPSSNTEVDTRASQASVNALHDQIILLQNQNELTQGVVQALPLGTIIVEQQGILGADVTSNFKTNVTAPFSITTKGGVGQVTLNGLPTNVGIFLQQTLSTGSFVSNFCTNVKGNNLIINGNFEESIKFDSPTSIVNCVFQNDPNTQ